MALRMSLFKKSAALFLVTTFAAISDRLIGFMAECNAFCTVGSFVFIAPLIAANFQPCSLLEIDFENIFVQCGEILICLAVLLFVL